jgi:hypothetical protein
LVGLGEEGVELGGGLGAWTESALFSWTLGPGVGGGGNAFGDGLGHCIDVGWSVVRV